MNTLKPCKRGHDIGLRRISNKGTLTCLACLRKQKADWKKSEKGKASQKKCQKKYKKSEKGKASEKKYQKEYKKSEKGKASNKKHQKKYKKSEKGKASKEKYQKSELGLWQHRQWLRALRAGLPTSQKHRERALKDGSLSFETLSWLTR